MSSQQQIDLLIGSTPEGQPSGAEGVIRSVGSLRLPNPHPEILIPEPKTPAEKALYQLVLLAKTVRDVSNAHSKEIVAQDTSEAEAAKEYRIAGEKAYQACLRLYSNNTNYFMGCPAPGVSDGQHEMIIAVTEFSQRYSGLFSGREYYRFWVKACWVIGNYF